MYLGEIKSKIALFEDLPIIGETTATKRLPIEEIIQFTPCDIAHVKFAVNHILDIPRQHSYYILGLEIVGGIRQYLHYATWINRFTNTPQPTNPNFVPVHWRNPATKRQYSVRSLPPILSHLGSVSTNLITEYRRLPQKTCEGRLPNPSQLR